MNEIKMTCEHKGCSSTVGNDYKREGQYIGKGWEDEPVYLCAIHSKGIKPLKMIKLDCWLHGLSSPKSGTMSLVKDDTHTFWAPFEMPKDRYDALFTWAKNDDEFWKLGWIATVECEKLADDGCPINGKIIEVRQWDLPHVPVGAPVNHQYNK